jgi:hypothetical protein
MREVVNVFCGPPSVLWLVRDVRWPPIERIIGPSVPLRLAIANATAVVLDIFDGILFVTVPGFQPR